MSDYPVCFRCVNAVIRIVKLDFASVDILQQVIDILLRVHAAESHGTAGSGVSGLQTPKPTHRWNR